MVALGYINRYTHYKYSLQVQKIQVLLNVKISVSKPQLFKFARLLNTMTLKENKHLKLFKAVYAQFIGLKLTLLCPCRSHISNKGDAYLVVQL